MSDVLSNFSAEQIYGFVMFAVTWLYGEIAKEKLTTIPFWVKMAAMAATALLIVSFQGVEAFKGTLIGYISLLAAHTSIINPLENQYKNVTTKTKQVKARVPVELNSEDLKSALNEAIKNKENLFNKS